MTLVADEGKVYTNGTVYGKTIDLGVSDSSDNWYQISENEMPTEPTTELEEYKKFHADVMNVIMEGE